MKALSIARLFRLPIEGTVTRRCRDERNHVMSGTLTPEQAEGEAADLRGPAGPHHRSPEPGTSPGRRSALASRRSLS